MRFCQLNRITLLEIGFRIEASRTLATSEDYLRDHFPRFPVMPGVLMLEALFQASALLVRATEGYKSGLVLLQEVKNVKFADFVQPGQTLDITAEILKQENNTTLLKAVGVKGGVIAVQGRLVLATKTLSGNGQLSSADRHANDFMRKLVTKLSQEPVNR